MSVLIVFYDETGQRFGQCDKRCYEAEAEECYCKVCGGSNHGVGYHLACVQTFECAERWCEFESQRIKRPLTFKSRVPGKQLSLPL